MADGEKRQDWETEREAKALAFTLPLCELYPRLR